MFLKLKKKKAQKEKGGRGQGEKENWKGERQTRGFSPKCYLK